MSHDTGCVPLKESRVLFLLLPTNLPPALYHFLSFSFFNEILLGCPIFPTCNTGSAFAAAGGRWRKGLYQGPVPAPKPALSHPPGTLGVPWTTVWKPPHRIVFRAGVFHLKEGCRSKAHCKTPSIILRVGIL